MSLIGLCCVLTVVLDVLHVFLFQNIDFIIRVSPIIIGLCYEVMFHLLWSYSMSMIQIRELEDYEKARKEKEVV